MSQTTDQVISGKLSLVATPIGNLEDMTYRGVRTLEEADVVFAEDTRRTRILLDHFGIKKHLESYHIYNEHGRTRELLERVRNGEKIVLVSDAGTPCIADPGFLLMRTAVEAGMEPEIIPGVSALTFSISASALPSDKFAFYGFLPVKSGRRASVLETIAAEDKSCVIFESPFRVKKLLGEIVEKIGSGTRTALIREATKIHEHVYRGTAESILDEISSQESFKGECVVVVFPVQNQSSSGEEEED